MVAQVEWVWQIPPISGKALYNTAWVGVSEEGFNSPQLHCCLNRQRPYRMLAFVHSLRRLV